jgi:23S rRNA (guanine745-N1)-methyltransferase
LPEGTLVCPIDGTRLRPGDGAALACGTLVCEHRHSFDRSREGYYNLLAVQHKASLDPGDSKAMVTARRRVLETGIYFPIAECVADLVARFARASGRERDFCVVDAGCGEGYYLRHIEKRIEAEGGPKCGLAGVDISKWAVQKAAKRTQGCFWAVATNRHLPFAPGSADVILCMFGFPVWAEFAAVQPPGGIVLMVDPGPEHLVELRSIIYPSVHRSEISAVATAATRAGYDLEKEKRIQFQADLYIRAQISDLLAMTPHDHRAPIAGREALGRHERLRVTVDVVLRLMRLRA